MFFGFKSIKDAWELPSPEAKGSEASQELGEFVEAEELVKEKVWSIKVFLYPGLVIDSSFLSLSYSAYIAMCFFFRTLHASESAPTIIWNHLPQIIITEKLMLKVYENCINKFKSWTKY